MLELFFFSNPFFFPQQRVLHRTISKLSRLSMIVTFARKKKKSKIKLKRVKKKKINDTAYT